MANLRDVRLRIKAISQTLQVTSAMNLISTSKLRKGRLLLADTEPYFNRIQKTLREIMSGAGKEDDLIGSPFFAKPEAKGRTAVIAVTSDKGLAGGYNANIYRYVNDMCEKIEHPVIILCGLVGQRYFADSPWKVLESFSLGGRIPRVNDVDDITDFIISQFEWGMFSEVRIVYTHMYNTLKLLPVATTILPVSEATLEDIPDALPDTEEIANGGQKHQSPAAQLHFEYLPSKKAVFNTLVPHYVKGMLYGCLVEAYASEQSSRMSAMDEASRNARDMIAEQQLFYNRVRQAGITQEVTEIVAGSAALKE